ncbi:MAG: ABC transporter ATP-binding protein [Actinomycetota bacterium]
MACSVPAKITNTAQTIIETDNLVKIYGSGEAAVKALRGISIRLNGGEFVAIMGPSGSGKSTLMHLIGCLDQPTSGHYKLEGRPVEKISDDELAEIRNEKIGFVFQQFNLLPRTTSLENVMLPVAYSKVRRKIGQEMAIRTLGSMGLEKRINRWPSELSGGEQQRVAIARAIVNNPSIILADEPTGALDTKSGDEVMAIFEKLNSEGKTIVLITHERYIAEYAERIVHLRDGKVESDEPNHRKR